ncbi:hypothetical protein V6N13_126606 [Hibiscus sabdariffa]|uniref:S1 motif domain-containing protein n=1 Tax=Hibiscus sabdariffa TaxID=183260 RepID=A0ABR2Q0N2_9ROSI
MPNLEGMILFSELSRRRIRSVSSLIKVGRTEPVMVLRVDKEKGYIDLSKRRVSEEDIQACEERYNKSKLVHSIMRHVAETLDIDLEKNYGKVLASVGHLKKVVLIWNMDTLGLVRTSEGHSLLITDVCFRQNSTIFATSSFDKTVRIWDSDKPRKSLFKLVGYADQVLSLDFHPRTVDLLCSCDNNNEMRLWNIDQRTCIHVSKAATKQVRFQPQLGRLIATASGNVINLIDVETNKPQFCLKGHDEDVLSICWDPCGEYIASISENSARVWSVLGGECLHELRSTGNKFQSCTFHPAYSQLLVIGGYQCLELWNPIESNKTLTVEAHRGLISSLAVCLETEMIASASLDQCVKLWK